MRRALARFRLAVVITAIAGDAGCGRTVLAPDAPEEPVVPVANPAREILDTKLAFDLAGKTATAAIAFGASAEPGATLEIGDLAIESVKLDGVDLPFAAANRRLDLALPPRDQPATVAIAYRWKHHEQEGASASGYTMIWPYHCGNLFPCHSSPSDGTTFQLELTGVPAGKTAVFPAAIHAEAPSYQIAWAIDDYVELALGATAAGTQLSVWHQPADAAKAQQGSVHTVAAFDWLERTIGPYRFGPKAGTVSVRWGPGALGGMEHHPFWHVGAGALASIETNVHEAAHGWFGGGVRLGCWEDFVLSEGTVTYLTARALDVVAPEAGANTWTTYAQELGPITGEAQVWPRSCNTVDIINDGLFSRAPYVRGAFFYRAVAMRVTADKLDEALGAFYRAHATKAATMADMLATIREVTGFDPTACAEQWLRSATPPAIGPCT